MLAACGEAPAGDETDELEIGSEDDGKADGETELRVRTGDGTIRIER